MPSLCRDLKIEYDALRALTKEFVLSCEKAGDPRALSADQLRTLQIQKQKIEQARDALKEKIEDRETKVWKNTWKTLMVATVESERSRYQGMTIAEVLTSDVAREEVAEEIKENARDGALSVSRARNAAGLFTSACALELLSDEQKTTLRAEIKIVRGMILFIVRDHVSKGLTDGYEGLCGVIGVNVACQLGILELTDGTGIDLTINDRKFREMLVKEIVNREKKGPQTGFDTASVVTGYSAARELELLEKEESDRVLEMVEKDDFQKSLVQYLLNVLNGDQIPIGGTSFIEVIAAIKKLIELSRRREPRT